jgi:hypothetical protein
MATYTLNTLTEEAVKLSSRHESPSTGASSRSGPHLDPYLRQENDPPVSLQGCPSPHRPSLKKWKRGRRLRGHDHERTDGPFHSRFDGEIRGAGHHRQTASTRAAWMR